MLVRVGLEGGEGAVERRAEQRQPADGVVEGGDAGVEPGVEGDVQGLVEEARLSVGDLRSQLSAITAASLFSIGAAACTRPCGCRSRPPRRGSRLRGAARARWAARGQRCRNEAASAPRRSRFRMARAAGWLCETQSWRRPVRRRRQGRRGRRR